MHNCPLLHPVGTGKKFLYIMQRRVWWEIAGGHENVSPVGIWNLGNTFGNRFTDKDRISAKYRVDHIHVPCNDDLFATDPVCFSEGYRGIDRDAVSPGFRIECKLGTNISTLMKDDTRDHSTLSQRKSCRL